jgi:hypothetical protein
MVLGRVSTVAAAHSQHAGSVVTRQLVLNLRWVERHGVERAIILLYDISSGSGN